ncbi:MAG: ABC transporter substrate-binding protein [Microvirga sp.]
MCALLIWNTPASAPTYEPFRDEMQRLGYVQGRNVDIEFHYASGRTDRLNEMAADLARRRVAVIVAGGTTPSHAAKATTGTIPIVMVAVSDPLATGLVENIARPTANVTGVALSSPEMGSKRVQLLRDLLPDLKRIGFLGSTTDRNSNTFQHQLAASAETIGAALITRLVGGAEEFSPALDGIVDERAQAVVIQPFFVAEHSKTIADLAMDRRLPSIADYAVYAHSGGLLSYGADLSGQFRRAAHYVDKLLTGAKPSELPVEQPTEFVLVVNRRTAGKLGLSISQALIVQADEVIE